jgi:Ca2+-binding EF-hand superfamily protein
MLNQNITNNEIDICHKIFQIIDMNNDGYIEIKELKSFIKDMGYSPSDKELFALISEINIEGCDHINFDLFLDIIVKEKQKKDSENDQNILNAFVALGGNCDKTGTIDYNKIVNILNEVFDDYQTNFHSIFKQIDSPKDSQHCLDFSQFRELLNN